MNKTQMLNLILINYLTHVLLADIVRIFFIIKQISKHLKK